jgi:hypothetical protein
MDYTSNGRQIEADCEKGTKKFADFLCLEEEKDQSLRKCSTYIYVRNKKFVSIESRICFNATILIGTRRDSISLKTNSLTDHGKQKSVNN